jgi:hypothetical protein
MGEAARILDAPDVQEGVTQARREKQDRAAEEDPSYRKLDEMASTLKEMRNNTKVTVLNAEDIGGPTPGGGEGDPPPPPPGPQPPQGRRIP